MTLGGMIEVFGQPTTVELRGHLFSKKNNRGYDPRHGRVFITDPDAAAIKWLVEQGRHQWAGRPPAVNPAVMVEWFVAIRNRDRDGAWTTLLDALQAARVLKSDNMANFGGPEFHAPIRVVPSADQERVVITFWREWRYAAGHAVGVRATA